MKKNPCSDGQEALVHPDVSVESLQGLVRDNRYSTSYVFRVTQEEVLKRAGIPVERLDDIVPPDYRLFIDNLIRTEKSRLCKERKGLVRPFPYSFDYSVDVMQLFNIVYAHEKREELLWRIVFGRIGAFSGTRKYVFFGTRGDESRRIVRMLRSEYGVDIRWQEASTEATLLDTVLRRRPLRKRLYGAALNLFAKASLYRQCEDGVDVFLHHTRFGREISGCFRHSKPRIGVLCAFTDEEAAFAAINKKFCLIHQPLVGIKGDKETRVAAERLVDKAKAVIGESTLYSQDEVLNSWCKGLWGREFLEKADRDVTTVRYYWRLFDKIRPRVFFVEGEWVPPMQAIFGWSRGNGSKVVMYDHGLQMGGKVTKGHEYSESDFVMVFSEHLARQRQRQEIGDAVFLPVGNPRHKKWEQRGLGCRPGTGVLFCPSGLQEDFWPEVGERFWRIIDRVARGRPDTRIVVRPHNYDLKKRMTNDGLDRLAVHHNVSLSKARGIEEDLEDAYLVVTTVSTTALDAMVLGRPVVVVKMIGRDEGFKQYLGDSVVDTEDDAVERVFGLIDTEKNRERTRKSQQTYCRLYSGREYISPGVTIASRIEQLATKQTNEPESI